MRWVPQAVKPVKTRTPMTEMTNCNALEPTKVLARLADQAHEQKGAELRQVTPSGVAIEAHRGESRRADQESARNANTGAGPEDAGEQQPHECRIAPERCPHGGRAHFADAKAQKQYGTERRQ